MPGESGEGVERARADDRPPRRARRPRQRRGALRGGSDGLADRAGRPGPALPLRARRHPRDQRLPGAGGPRLRRPRARAARASRASTSAACLEEAMRLWPTTAMLSRETTEELEWSGETIPAGTQVVIVNTFSHRDRDRVDGADRFDPDAWIDGDAASYARVQPLQPRPPGLPRHRDRDRRRRAGPGGADRPLRPGRRIAAARPLRAAAAHGRLLLDPRRPRAALGRAGPRAGPAAPPRRAPCGLRIVGASELERRLDQRAEEGDRELLDRQRPGSGRPRPPRRSAASIRPRP